MQVPGREPSMEEILASIKKVIAEDKGVRPPEPAPEREALADSEDDDVLELNEALAPAVDLGPPLLDDTAADTSRSAFEQLSTVAATVPAVPQANPLEDMMRQLGRPMLKQWRDDHLRGLVDEHVRREISRITGRPV